MRTRREQPIQIKTPSQLAAMREAGLVVARALQAAAAAVQPGVSTAELDAIAHLNTGRHDDSHATDRPASCVGFSANAARGR